MKDKGTVYPAILLAVTFGVVGPLQLYLVNHTELWFGIGDIWWMCLLGGAVIFVGSMVFSILLHERLRDFFNCLLFGIALGLYLQGNYINADYGVLDGRTIDWSQYTTTAVVNTAVWLICLAVPLIAVCLRPEAVKKALKWASLFLVAVQILALVITLATTNLEKAQDAFISTEGLNEVSEEGNVIVFILDTYDDQVVKGLLMIEPEFFSDLDGFTYFTNNTGMYPTTKGAIPFILTGDIYQNEQPFNIYVEEAYAKTDYYKDLKEARYNIGLYPSGVNYIGLENCRDYVSNLAFNGVKISNPLKMLKLLYKFTGFRYFPHLLKHSVWFYSGEFDECKVSVDSDQQVYSGVNLPYYTSLVQEKLTLAEDGKCYRVIHLDGAHGPYTLTEDLQEVDDGSATIMSQSKAALKIVYEYIRQLKELGIYDQTTLVILSDHGTVGSRPRNPIFFFKGRNCRGPLQLSDAPVSQEDIQATIMSDLGMNESEKYGRSALDIQEGEVRDRRFFFYEWDHSWSEGEYLPSMYEFDISTDKNGVNNFFFTGVVHTADGVEYSNYYEYVLGDEIICTREGKGSRYFLSGMDLDAPEFVWSLGHYGRMFLDLGEVRTDMTGTIEFVGVLSGGQHIIIKNGEEVLYDGTVLSTDPVVSFYIPEHCIDEGKLILDFEYPNAFALASIGEGESTNLLAVMYYKIQFDAATAVSTGGVENIA